MYKKLWLNLTGFTQNSQELTNQMLAKPAELDADIDD